MLHVPPTIALYHLNLDQADFSEEKGMHHKTKLYAKNKRVNVMKKIPQT